MKAKHRSRFAVVFTLFVVLATSAWALTVPVAEDTSTDRSGLLTPLTGSAPLLPVSLYRTAFIRFNLTDPNVIPAAIKPGNLTSATLQLYVVSAKAPADITISVVTSPWSEKIGGPEADGPAIDSSIVATIPAASLVGKNFVTVDVTTAVIAALTGGYNFGFALQTGDPSASVNFSSKEGTVNGWAPMLDLEADLARDNSGGINGTSITLSEGLNAYSATFTNSLSAYSATLGGGLAAQSASLTGNLTAANVTINNSLSFHAPSSSSDPNLIYSGTIPLLHATPSNLFLGFNAGTEADYPPTSGYAGNGNTGIGHQALLLLNSGYHNVAVGTSALAYNTTGHDNVAIGYEAAWLASADPNPNGAFNIAIGSGAGVEVAGNYNIEIGNRGASESGTIRIGDAAHHTATYIAGITGSTAASGVAVYVDANGHLGTLTSSAKFKRDIQPMAEASDALLSLKPVTFRYQPALDPAGLPQFGLVAEEVAKVDPDLVAHDAQGGIYTVRYEAVNAMLLNEFLKEHQRVQTQGQTIAEQQKEIRALSARLTGMDEEMKKIARLLEGSPAAGPYVRQSASASTR